MRSTLQLSEATYTSGTVIPSLTRISPYNIDTRFRRNHRAEDFISQKAAANKLAETGGRPLREQALI